MKEHYIAVISKISKEYLDERIIKINSGCWEWQQSLLKKGYGRVQFWFNGIKYTIGAHRVSYMLYNNQDPGDKFVCHSCDNPRCINPEHLWMGTHQENMNDMNKKGRLINKNLFEKGNKIAVKSIIIIDNHELKLKVSFSGYQEKPPNYDEDQKKIMNFLDMHVISLLKIEPQKNKKYHLLKPILLYKQENKSSLSKKLLI